METSVAASELFNRTVSIKIRTQTPNDDHAREIRNLSHCTVNRVASAVVDGGWCPKESQDGTSELKCTSTRVLASVIISGYLNICKVVIFIPFTTVSTLIAHAYTTSSATATPTNDRSSDHQLQ